MSGKRTLLLYFVLSCLLYDAIRHVGESITQQQLVTQTTHISTLGNSHATDERCASAPWWSLQASRDYPARQPVSASIVGLSTPQARWKGKASYYLPACSYTSSIGLKHCRVTALSLISRLFTSGVSCWRLCIGCALVSEAPA